MWLCWLVSTYWWPPLNNQSQSFFFSFFFWCFFCLEFDCFRVKTKENVFLRLVSSFIGKGNSDWQHDDDDETQLLWDFTFFFYLPLLFTEGRGVEGKGGGEVMTPPLYEKYIYLFFQKLPKEGKFVSFCRNSEGPVAKVHTKLGSVGSASSSRRVWASPAPEESPTCGPV